MPATTPLRHPKECRRRKCNNGEIPHATLRKSICIFEEKVLAKNIYIKKALHRAAVQYPYGAWTSCLWHTNYPGIRPPGSGGAGNQPCVGEPLVPYTAFLLRPPLLNAIVAENFLLRKHYLKCISIVSLSVVWKTS